MSTDLRRHASELDHTDPRTDPGTPGKRSLTAGLAGRPQIVFRVESAEAAAVFADAFGPRDRNGVADGADVAVDRAAGSSGSPLPEDLRGRFESSLGADLSSVRVHTGGESAEASSAVGAKAYTTGQNIHFGAGQYDPSSAFGVHLIAHEVAHTVQQQGTAPIRQNKLEVSAPQDSAEVEADRAADAMVGGAAAGAKTAGKPLPVDVERQAEHGFGVDMSSVRVHDDADAAAATSSMGYRAYAYGDDVYFGGGEYAPDQPDRRFVLMHELAHVAQARGQAPAAQGKAEVGTPGDAAEVEADQAAASVLAGGTAQITPRRPALRGFGNTAPKDYQTGAADPNAICHENQTLPAADAAGFTPQAGAMIFSGSWQRDMNQFLIPMIMQQKVGPVIMEVMSILHADHFGAPLPGTSEGPSGAAQTGAQEFETYDPVDHLDSPGGLRANEINAQEDVGGNPIDSAMMNPADTLDKQIAISGDAALASSDPRYTQLANEMRERAFRKDENGKIDKYATVENTHDHAAYHVDQSGIPVYIQVSRQALKTRLGKAITLAQSNPEADGTEHDVADRGQGGSANWQHPRNRALRMAGDALHIMQDYYAHSNFCEVAINILLDEGLGTAGDKEKRDLDGETVPTTDAELAEVVSKLKELDADAGKHRLDSKLHKHHEADTNRARQGPDGQRREVMTTGTFLMEDTVHSLKAKLSGVLESTNPFKKSGTGPSDMGIAVCRWMEGNPEYAPNIGGAIKGAARQLDATLAQIDTLMETANLKPAIDMAVPVVVPLLLGAPKREGKPDDGGAAEVKTGLRAVITNLGSGNGGLEGAYRYACEVAESSRLENRAKQIPVVGNDLSTMIKKAMDGARDDIRTALEASWQAAVKRIIADLDAACAVALQSSAVRTEADRASNASKSLAEPTHTDIAKDFDQHGPDADKEKEWLRDRKKKIEELKASSGDLLGISIALAKGEITMEEAARIKAGLAVDADGHDDHDHDADDGKGHRHGGAWLAGLAHGMAGAASTKILGAFRHAIDAASGDVENHETMAVVDRYFAHPADCMGTWRSTFMGALKGAGDDSETLRKELAKRTASPPSEQAPNMEEHADH